jgi:predicted  nucleic acid-binding Zn-ribbon protein
MPDEFQFDVFLSHSAKDKPVVRELAARLKKDGVHVWLDEEQIKPGDSIPAKIEEGLEHSRVLVLCMSAHAFGSDWAQLEAGTFRFRDPLNKERRFIPLRLDDAPIKGSLAQFLYINWCQVDCEQEYAKLLEACRHPAPWPQSKKPGMQCANRIQNSNKSSVSDAEISQLLRQVTSARRNEWNRLRADFEAQAKLYPDLKLQIFCIGINGAFPKGEYNQPNHMINLWQYYGDGDEARNRLATSEFTKFGVMGAEITAYGIVLGKETELFCRMASRAGSLLPNNIDDLVLKNIRRINAKSPASIVVANRNPLAKWLNLLMIATVNSCPERYESGRLAIDPFAASLTAFDFYLTLSDTEQKEGGWNFARPEEVVVDRDSRDDFPARIKDTLARRVGMRCSNPACQRMTSGPQSDPNKAINIGVAAHITGASAGGPRYAPSLSKRERSSIKNGIWLCQNCSKLVDNDARRYTVELLQTWKKQAESDALGLIESGRDSAPAPRNQRFKTGLEDNSIKLEVTASLALENTDTRHGLLTIKALNSGTKVARIRRVAVVLMPDDLIKGSTIVPVSSELNIGQKQAVVTIEGDEDMHEWQQVLRFKPNFKVHEKEGERYGKGYIELTSGKRVEFEFLLLSDSAWDLLTAPIAPIFDGKMGHKCSHCGFIFLTQANIITVTCPKCKNVDHLRPKPGTVVLAKQQEKTAMAASAIRTAYLKIIGSCEDCTVLIEDKNMEKLRATQQNFQNDVNQFWQTFELNKVYLPENIESDIRVIVNTCVQYVRTCDRVQTLIDSKPTGNGQKMVDAQYLQIEKLEESINAMRPKIEAHFRRLLAGQ